MTTLKTKGHPAIGNLLRGMEAAETEGDRIVGCDCAKPGAQRAVTVANLPILSKAYYTASLRRNLDGAAARPGP